MSKDVKMALFGNQNAYLGLDIGTSFLKVVELVDRKKTIDVATYGLVNQPNILINPPANSTDAVKKVAQAVTLLLEKTQVSTDAVVAALPSSIVFSTVLTLPDIPDEDMEKAINFAARDVVPAKLSEMLLGWSRVGETPHMKDTAEQAEKSSSSPQKQSEEKAPAGGEKKIPVFMTAAPKDVVARYEEVMQIASLELVALEVETSPLTRSLLGKPNDSALIVDIGDQVTTYHLIDTGTARVTHSIDYGGQDITQSIARTLQLDKKTAEDQKIKFGLTAAAPPEVKEAALLSTQKMIDEAQRLLNIHNQQSNHTINRTVLIGGGAKLKGLAEVWASRTKHQVTLGDPWRGLSYPEKLNASIQELGPTFAVAIGLAQRQLRPI